VVEGGASQGPMRKTLSAFKCTKCTEELGLMAHTMVQVLRNPHEAKGKLIAGSLWWACGRWVPSGMWLELTWRDLRHNEVIWSSGEVNRLIDELGSQGLPSIDFAHIDLT
ncbi:MAG TPA: hypothetical protein VHJ58_21095, partial [Vicinamibacterales bacterium]|nr:hypothetical protein [Vicinamibacterales bacterium]